MGCGAQGRNRQELIMWMSWGGAGSAVFAAAIGRSVGDHYPLSCVHVLAGVVTQRGTGALAN